MKATSLASLGLLVLMLASPSVGAVSIGPKYHTQCYGTQQGTVYRTQVGTYLGGTWKNNFSSGHLGLGHQAATSTGSWSTYETLGWISMGPGPTNGLCFTPSSVRTNASFTFSNVSFFANVSAICTAGDNGSAAASFHLWLQGDFYDLTTAKFVWGTTHLTSLVASIGVHCPGTGVYSFAKLYSIPSITLSGHTRGLSTSDQYWYIVNTDLLTRASANGLGSSAHASVSKVSMTLTGIACRSC
ncbi:MAG: hypothetical protein L3K01_00560 [Thermoplasmata archaeon]|nr:hypothetical protein [Thermoplasmata archaeon]